MAAILSIIVPAYNERERLPAFLKCIRAYCDATFGDCYEVIVVNDGSSDGTKEYVDQSVCEWPMCSGVHHSRNLGKGAAVRSGMHVAQGDYWLFADADGATPIREESKLREAIADGADIAVGSRPDAAAAAFGARPLTRRLLSSLFRQARRLLFTLGVRDCQCGFKMFQRAVGRRLVALTEEQGYLFDLELLILARDIGYSVTEVPVAWSDVAGSKIRVVRDSLEMLLGLLRLRFRSHALGSRRR